MKKTISIRQFVQEFGDDFSKHTKQRMLELGSRCVLTRKDDNSILDLRHVEHIKYDNPNMVKKEYAYGQFIVNEGNIYFSDHCVENEDVMQAPVVDTIYRALASEALILDEGIKAKKIGDENIDYVIDSILGTCPDMSPEHKAIISRY